MEIKSCKVVKSLDFFFKATTSALVISEILFVLVKSYSISPIRLQRFMKKALFLRFLEKRRNVLITRFDNLEDGERNCCFGKKSGKSLELWIQTFVRTLYIIRRSLL